MIASIRSFNPAGLWAGLITVGILATGLFLGSRNLRHYDPILLTYTFGMLFSAFAIAYRCALWVRRPPTGLLLKRGWEILRRGKSARLAIFLARSVWANLLAHRFIRRRGSIRWIIHSLIAWGTLLAVAVTFPLVFGWLRFETRPDDLEVYGVRLFDLKIGEFHPGSLAGFVIFNLLNLSAFLVTLGALLSLHRRLRTKGSAARQQFGNDIVPLLLLLAISLTGLLLTFSMHALAGAGYPVLSLLHALAVTATLLYIPFGKFFHVFQRPAHLAALLCRRDDETAPRRACRRCRGAFAGVRHLADLRSALEQSGFTPDLDLCPSCKRKRMVVEAIR